MPLPKFLAALARLAPGALLASGALLAACREAVEEEPPLPFRNVGLLSRFEFRHALDEALDIGGRPDERAGSRWYPTEPSPDGSTWRWSQRQRVDLNLFLERPRAGRVLVRARTTPFLPDQELALSVNGRALGARPVASEARLLAFPVAAEELRAGENSLQLLAPRAGQPSALTGADDTRLLSFACDWVGFVEADAPDPVPNRYPTSPPPSGAKGAVGLRAGEQAWARMPALALSRVEVLAHAPAGAGTLRIEVADALGGEAPVRLEQELGAEPGLSVLPLQHLSRRVCDVRLTALGGEVVIDDAKLFGDGPDTDVILIVVDTLRADHVSDAPDGATPNLARLGRDGFVFERALSHAPMTLPATTALFSSRWPHESGVTNNGYSVPGDLPLFADWMGDLGFETVGVASIGTLYPGAENAGLDRGFRKFLHDEADLPRADESLPLMRRALDQLDPREPSFLFFHFSDPHEPYNASGGATSTGRILVDGEVVASTDLADARVWQGVVKVSTPRPLIELKADGRFLVRRIDASVESDGGDEVELDFMGSRLGRELAAFSATPKQALPEGTRELALTVWWHDAVEPRGVAARYAREVHFVDEQIGLLLDELRARGMYDDALIVFTSDHGEDIGEDGRIGHVENLYDGLIHVPLVIKPPRGLDFDEELDAASRSMAEHIDVVPTVLDMLGLPPLPGQRGTSLLRKEERLHFAETHEPEASRPLLSLRDERYKLIHAPRTDSFELYDLRADPGEQHDLFAARGAEFRAWQEQLVFIAEHGGTGLQTVQDPEVLEQLGALGYASDDRTE